MADVFISYETDSAEEIAQKISASLDDISISCWYASRDMEPGFYADTIQREIKNCKVFVVILSAKSMQSPHVYNELHIAMERVYHHEEITVIPFRVDNSKLDGKFQYFLQGLDTVNDGATANGRIHQAKLRKLLKQVSSALRKSPSPHLNGKNYSKPPRWLYIVIVGCAILILLFLILVLSGIFPLLDHSIDIYNYSIPGNSLLKGDGFGLRGEVRSENCPLTYVSAIIRDNSGNVVISYDQYWNQNTYDIKSDGMNDNIAFGNLSAGNYRFSLYASNAHQTNANVINSDFSIVSWTPPIDIVGETLPSGHMKRGPYDLWGYIISAYPITEVSANVYNNAHDKVTLDDFDYHAYPERTRYSLFSDGLNNDFHFSNLEPGDYVFEIKATYSTKSPKGDDESTKTISRTTFFTIIE